MKSIIQSIGLVLMLVAGLASCQSEEEAHDEVLTGSVWEGLELYPTSNLPEELFMSNNFEKILSEFSSAKFTCTVSQEKKEVLDTVKVEKHHMKHRLTFHGETCAYHQGVYANATLKRLEYHYKDYVFEPGVHSHDFYPMTTLIITPHEIIWKHGATEKKLRKLNNGKLHECSGSRLLETIEKEIILNPVEFTLKFQRKDDKVLLENDQVQWMGHLDSFAKRMDVTEYDDENKVLFSLKRN